MGYIFITYRLYYEVIKMATKHVLFKNYEDDYSFNENGYYSFKSEIHGIKTENKIICIADLGLWSGRKQAYKLLGNDLSSVLNVINSDYNDIEYWIDGYGNLRARLGHHDGTNYVLFRELKKPDDSIVMQTFMNKIYNGNCTKQDITRYTDSLKKYLGKIYNLG